MNPIIKIEHIRKQFGKVIALEDVCFELRPTEVLGLIGDNGAGKSTLVKIIAGVLQADSGNFTIKNCPVDLKKYTSTRARAIGIETVHQDRALGDKQPVWRNLFMGRHMTNSFGIIKKKEEKEAAHSLLKNFIGLSGAGIHADIPVSMLSGGEQQGLAIGRAVYFDSDIVILDEPCNALAINEVRKVLSFIHSLKKHKKAVIIISHNLHQVYEVSDRFVLMHQGRVKDDFLKTDISLDILNQKLVSISR